MQGLWSNHRRKALNLNAPPSPGVSNPPTPSVEEPVTPGPSTLAETPVISTDEVEPEGPAPTALLSAKRKLRTSRTTEGSSKRSKTAAAPPSGGSNAKDYSPPTTRLSDLGGVEDIIERILELVTMPIQHPEIYLHTGVHAPRGVLLHGPPGCGKTLIAHAIAGVSQTLLFLSQLLNFFAGSWRPVHQPICTFNRVWNVWRI